VVPPIFQKKFSASGLSDGAAVLRACLPRPITQPDAARSFRICKRSSVTSSIAASPMRAIAATTPPDHKFKVYITGPEAPPHATDQTRIQTAGRHRARHRPLQGNTAAWAASPCRGRSSRGRPQLSPPVRVVDVFVAWNSDRAWPSRSAKSA
jgi:hypothetical protein